ncbi:MAG: tyrosine-type recombinase/integrase [Planctomycetes bacterium]|nr:tyrosine-type recombinase/integrase [Planctomycetota bacterium]
MSATRRARAELDDVLALLRRDLQRRGAAAATIRTLASTARTFLSRVTPPLVKLEREDVARYLAARARELSRSSLRSELTRLRALFRALLAAGVVARDATEGLVVSRPARRAQVVLGQASVARLLAASGVAAEDADARVRALALRNRAALELLYGLGLRQSELREARLVDLDLGGGSLRVRSAKRGRARTLPVPAACVPWLERWLREGRPVLARGEDEARLIVSDRGRPLSTCDGVWRVVRGVARRAGVVVSPHVLRRSVATHLVRAGVNVKAVQALLGHASLTTTALYVAVDQADLRAAVERLPGTSG